MKCNLLSRFASLFRKCSILVSIPLLVATAFANQPQLPNFDKRAPKAAQTNVAKKAAMDGIRAKVKDAKLRENEVVGGLSFVGSTHEFLTDKNGRGKLVRDAVADSIPDNDAHKPAKAFVKEHRLLFGFGPEALDAAKVKKDYVTKAGNFRTVIWQQDIDDIPVFEGVFKAHWTDDGKLINVSSRFVPDVAKAANKIANRKAIQATPTIGAKQAIVLAAKNIGDIIGADQLTELAQPIGNHKQQKFRGGQVLNNVQTHLTWLPMDDSTVQLCWEVMLVSRARGEGFNVLVDAQTGEVLVRHGLTEYISSAQYNVFTGDSPSPFSPGWSAPSTNQPPIVSRSLVSVSALSTIGSPNGWINDGDNTTSGNNVNAHLD
ncbi:MAG: hypothetical protein JWO95_538, partial [Verrucomicrobiales bacterium]|nr:hypothetical protein [Verrucomicrobiales bacterium]